MSTYTSELEGYNSQAKAQGGPTLSLSDFPNKGYRSSRKREFTREDKLKFYEPKTRTTVLLSRIQFTVEESPRKKEYKVISTSNAGTHAEEYFIQSANKCISKVRCEKSTIEEISIIMLINLSPCFKCRQELEYFLTTIVDDDIKVHFTLRTGKLYFDGFKQDEAERKLAFWKNDLEMQGVVVYFEAINVVTELPKIVSKSKEMKQQKRDKRNRECFERITMNTIAANKLIKSLPKDIQETHFIEENGKQIILGELTVSAVTYRRVRVSTTDIPLLTGHVRENPEEKIIQKARSLPHCWELIRKHLLLLCVEVPSSNCLEQIIGFLTDKQFPPVENMRNKLVMYIANVPDHGVQRKDLIEWIKRLEKEAIHFCLEPLYTLPALMSGYTAKRYATLCDQFEKLKEEIQQQTMSVVDHKAFTFEERQIVRENSETSESSDNSETTGTDSSETS